MRFNADRLENAVIKSILTLLIAGGLVLLWFVGFAVRGFSLGTALVIAPFCLLAFFYLAEGKDD